MAALNLVIPCYNPPKNWALDLLDRVKAFKSFIGRDFSLILVNDASKEGIDKASIELLKSNLSDFQYISYSTNHGKGYALREGIRPIVDGIILYTDIDFPYEFESMKSVIESIESGQDIAVGTRDDVYYENTPKKRTLISKVLRWMLRRVFRLPITDTQCGLKAFNQNGKQVFMETRIERFLFDMEFIALASGTKNIKMSPVAVSLRNNIQFSKMNTKILLTESVNLIRIFWLTHFRR